VPTFIIENGFSFKKYKDDLDWDPAKIFKEFTEKDHILVQAFLENKIYDMGVSLGLNYFNFELSFVLF
jgi:hypothetical protein